MATQGEIDHAAVAAEIERQRRTSRRLLDDFASAMRRTPVRNAAHYLQEHYWNKLEENLIRIARQRPGISLVVAVVAGYAVGRLIRPR